MKNYNQKDWDIEKKKLINKISSTSDSEFDLEHAKTVIDITIPINCSNRIFIKDALEKIKSGYCVCIGDCYINGNNPKENKPLLIQIIESIELDNKSNILKVFNKIKKWFNIKVGWKWLITIIISVISVICGIVKLFIKS